MMILHGAVRGQRARAFAFSPAGGNAMGMTATLTHEFHEAEARLLAELRSLRRGKRDKIGAAKPASDLTAGQKIADAVAAGMGSWRFIIIQSVLLLAWIALNVTAYIKHWDPYPFILLNLALSFQAAYAAPFIMMAQNRQQDVDRKEAENDYQINIKAELEIELLHQKIDELREKEVLALTKAISELTELLHSSHSAPDAPAAA
jgi:uncharacterized membrane protein